MRKINQAGIELIKKFEGLRLKAYLCPAGIPTIGYGSTAGVKLGDSITEEQAEEFLRRDLTGFERIVSYEEDHFFKPLTDNQFSALVAFAYNVGGRKFTTSTLCKLLRGGGDSNHIPKAADEFLKWNKAGGKVLAGLTKRREAERALFLSKDGQE